MSIKYKYDIFISVLKNLELNSIKFIFSEIRYENVPKTEVLRVQKLFKWSHFDAERVFD